MRELAQRIDDPLLVFAERDLVLDRRLVVAREMMAQRHEAAPVVSRARLSTIERRYAGALPDPASGARPARAG